MFRSFEETWETYAASWRLETRKEKQQLFEQALAADCRYTDPLTETRGWGPLLDYMLEFQRQIPGGHFLTKRFIVHHNRSIALWEMCDATGKVLGDGVSYAEYDADGKLEAMTGFFDTPS